MWQFAMIPDSSAGDPPPGKGRIHAGGPLCFMALALLHLAVIGVADFSGGRRPELPRSRIVVFDLLPPPPENRAPPEEPVPPLPVPAEPLPAAEAPVEAPPLLSAVPAPPETAAAAFAQTAFADATAGGVPAGRSRRAGMSEADYTALVMRRLEEKKIYPLSMRKRGIAGDAAVWFTIRPDGSLGSLRAGDGPAHPFLVQAALETVRSAAPFPVMEGSEEDYALRVTIRFQLE